MKFIFLAAGKSKRIFKKIKKNKCLISIKKKPLIQLLINEVRKSNIKDISIVVGFRANFIKKALIKNKDIKYIYNNKYKTTEMLYSLILALKKNNSDIIVSYSDILFNHKMINNLIKKSKKQVTIPILENWKKIWKIRNKDPLVDGETLLINNKKNVTSIGEKIIDLKKIKYQYMGIIYIPKKKRKNILSEYKKISKIKNMHASKFLNYLIEKKFIINSVIEKKGWYEFDDYEDYKNYKIFFGN